MKIIISGTSFLLPKNLAWEDLIKKYKLTFSSYGNWEKDLINCNAEDALVIVIFFEDILDFSIDNEKNIKNIFNTFFNLLKQRISTSNYPTLIMFGSLNRENPIRTSTKISLQYKINDWFYRKIEKLILNFKSLFFVNLNTIFAYKGLDTILDNRNWYSARCRLSSSGLFELSNIIYKIFERYSNPVSKVLILDCDNTLWGGVIAEDGLKNILLGQDGLGKAFYDFQKAIKSLIDKGVLIAIASKNEKKDVINVFRKHSKMIIKESDIISWKVNWNEKKENIISIGKELNLGLESFVFWDDNPIERDKIKLSLLDVKVVEVPEDIFSWSDYLNNLDYFSNFRSTKEDKNKQKQYLNRAKFISEKKQVINETNYLKSINLEPTAYKIYDGNIDRALQLCSKTNQFNLRTQRYQYDDINKIIKNNSDFCFITGLKDKYGDHGLVGFLCLKEINKDYIFLDNFLLSCRILGRYLESWILKEALKRSLKWGYKYLVGEYIKTERNSIVENLFKEYGFLEFTIKENMDSKVKDFIDNRKLYYISTNTNYLHHGDIYE